MNFNGFASYDDGGCDDNESYLNSNVGCMDPAFCNYNPLATLPGECFSTMQAIITPNEIIDFEGTLLSADQALQALENSSFGSLLGVLRQISPV